MRRTDVTTSDEPGGARIVVVARDASEVAWLRKEARDRLAEIESRR
jgi:hypothetical protein